MSYAFTRALLHALVISWYMPLSAISAEGVYLNATQLEYINPETNRTAYAVPLNIYITDEFVIDCYQSARVKQ